MMTLRCTQKLLRRIKVTPEIVTAPPSTTQGDWYANLLYLGRRQLVLCISERSFLPIVLLAKDSASLPQRLVEGVAWMLPRMGVSAQVTRTELDEMGAVHIDRTQSRRVLGVLNETAWALSFEVERYPTASPEEYGLRLADIPYGPIDYQSPLEVTRTLFGVGHADMPAAHDR